MRAVRLSDAAWPPMRRSRAEIKGKIKLKANGVVKRGGERERVRERDTNDTNDVLLRETKKQ